ncbi:hypothetical protein J18TS1_28450 [Oceanobacillus oncorhynchi subsp. incaldanensis]|uniref:DUF3679 domain-containing protein n=1 Tax=Oceanobacillus oncorhynchi TaxID=545501 RepID=A0A0A1MZN6_9BACI|nr:hypothetical protein [Oceanobacillus oncorhynchi]UUI38512.1 hypothetical protein NP440_14325 [Oceanobacillus oncorhynchi]GIO19745.1 hypothetical protein J18TS1_28450 [Oceanobacillus oncorhynchi subsp. incaldanensis]CEI84201.1 hypothetical protein BN997_04144 [Oceanobacillus oncorhynchi]
MRNIIILLLLVIFFLSGLVFGMQKNEPAEQTVSSDTPAVEVIEDEAQDREEQEEIIVAETDVLEGGNYSLTNRTAATMGGIVKQLFEVIVSIMYGIGELFF